MECVSFDRLTHERFDTLKMTMMVIMIPLEAEKDPAWIKDRCMESLLEEVRMMVIMIPLEADKDSMRT